MEMQSALVALLLPCAALAADPWPGGPGTDIGGNLPSPCEPSGVVWHTRLERLFVASDDGRVIRMDADGNGVTSRSPGGDIEGIAVADADTDYIYLGIEHPDSIREFDVAEGALTGKSWDLTPWMQSASSNLGLEALTFIPNGHHPYADGGSGGLFYAGLQEDGRIYVFDVDLSTGGAVSHVDVITPVAGRADLSGLHYATETRTLYAVFDGSSRIREMTAGGSFIAEYELPGSGQEGVTVVPSCPSGSAAVSIAEDSGGVVRYDGYPVACADVDADGLSDVEEALLGTDPDSPDTDGDGFSDSIEHFCGSDPLLETSVPDPLAVNFQPGAARIPARHCPDAGAAFSPRGHGWL